MINFLQLADNLYNSAEVPSRLVLYYLQKDTYFIRLFIRCLNNAVEVSRGLLPSTPQSAETAQKSNLNSGTGETKHSYTFTFYWSIQEKSCLSSWSHFREVRGHRSAALQVLTIQCFVQGHFSGTGQHRKAELEPRVLQLNTRLPLHHPAVSMSAFRGGSPL